MNKNCCEIAPDIYLVKIPFESVYTSVFFVLEGKEITLYDTATTKEDVDNYILPALEGFERDGYVLCRIVISHFHGDHAGGLKFVAEKYRDVPIYAGDADYFKNGGIHNVTGVSDGMKTGENLTLYRFCGHSHDCTAIFDGRTKTLLTADAFQCYGILRYGIYGDVGAWLDAIEKAKAIDTDNMITSHDYFPLGQTAFGKDKVQRYLDGCRECFSEIYGYVKKCKGEGITDLKAVADRYNGEKKARQPKHPTIGGDFMELVRNYFDNDQ